MKLRVECRGESFEIQAAPGAKLLDYLQHSGVPVNAACGGKGTCHKCRVRVQSGFLGITPIDRRAFREAELASGWRLSCQAIPRSNLEVLLPNAESLKSRPRILRNEAALASLNPKSELILACDLGSTGVVVAIAEKGATTPLLEAHLLNKQVPFGSDVMTRLHSAQKLGTEPLKKALDQTLEICLDALQQSAPELMERTTEKSIFCAGNSAMTSFLHEWKIDSLAVSPFQPEKREPSTSSLKRG
ncbi:MAG: 2Fe-2S iron-sulfur cluster binding domain-containing protein, partial [Bdellovibrionales bacterium]|nr:2Fe-2S iron-sulfur cluster binding domain-containing protein [Bdellovibrionales bacterium]